MSTDFMSDMSIRNRTTGTETSEIPKPKAGKNPGSTQLDMDDFLQLIVAQFQNQDPENAASTTDMMNMLVQMTTVQSLTTITDATTMLYTASLVGKEVTVGEIGKDGKVKEIVGTVTGTGTYSGEPIIFVDGVSYKLSSIMAVGKLPPPPEKPVDPPDPDKPVDPPDPETPPVDPPDEKE